HGGLPLFVIGYAFLNGEESAHARLTSALIAGAIAAALAGAGLFVYVGTALHQSLPAIMLGDHYTPVVIVVVFAGLGRCVVALACLWWHKRRSVLDLWLMVVLCAWLCDIALSAVLNAGRYDLGFYAGRIYGLLAASFVLVRLLLENSALYARERQNTIEAERLGGALAKANDALVGQNRQLEQADRLKSEFLANMSHELRTPLNAIIGFSEIMREGLAGPMSPKQREFANDIHQAGGHLLSLINDVLDLSKIEAGSMQLDLDSVALRSLLESSLAAVREKALSRGIVLTSEIDAGLGTLQADPRKVKQIVFNRLSNAGKSSDACGAVTLSARRVDRARIEQELQSAGRAFAPRSTDPEFVEITVTDTGVGIAADDLGRLFEAFVQVDTSRTRRHEGTGLGLALVS